MTAGETRIVERRAGQDLLRRVVLAGLAIYLAPAAIVVLLVGCVGLACCAALRLGGQAPRHIGDRPRCDGPAQAIAAPHLREAVGSRSPFR